MDDSRELELKRLLGMTTELAILITAREKTNAPEFRLTIPRRDELDARIERNFTEYETYRAKQLLNDESLTEMQIYQTWMLTKLSRLELLVELLFK